MALPCLPQSLRVLAAVGALALLSTAATGGSVLIRSGDTLWSLARQHHTTVATLQELNALAGQSTIYAGRPLLLPGSSGAAPMLPAPVPPAAVRASVAVHRALLAGRSQPGAPTVQALIRRAARSRGVDPALLLAVAYQESGFQQRVVSAVDAIGVMQVLPSTGVGLEPAAGRRLDLLSAPDNVLAGAILLASLLRRTGSVDQALAGYYQGLGSVARQGVLPQTRRYQADVQALRVRFTAG